MSLYSLDPNDANYYIQLSEALAIDSTADNNSFIQTDTRALTQFLSAGQDTDFAIYCEVPKWQFFNPSMDWRFTMTNLIDPGTGVLQGSVIQDAHNPSGTPVINLNNDIVLSDNTKNTVKNYVNTTRWTHFKQCSKFYNYSFAVGNTIIVPVQDTSGNAVLNSSGVALTRVAQLYAVYLDRVTGEPLPYAYSPDNNTQIFYYMDNVSTGNALTTIADSAALRTTIDNSGYLVTSIVPPNPNMVRRVPDSSGAGDNNITYLASLGQVTTFEVPPAGMRSDTQAITVNNIYLDGQYQSTSSSNSSDASAWMAFSKSTNQWKSAAGVYSVSTGAAYSGAIATACGAVNVSGEWVQLQLPRAIAVTSYRLAPIAANIGPARYSLYGSLTGTGSGWVLMDSRSNVTWATATAVTNVVSIPPTSMYQYYRLVLEQTLGSISAGIGELSLFDGAAVPNQYPSAAMTADTTTLSDGTYVASCSSSAANTGVDASANLAFRAFDRNDSTFFLSATSRYNWTGTTYTGSATTSDISGVTVAGEWVQLFTPTPVAVSAYSVTSSGRIASPVDFRLYGSYNGTDFHLLDTETGITEWGATLASSGSTRTFTVASNAFMISMPFNYYRLVIQKTLNNTQAILPELRLQAKASSFPNFKLPPLPLTASSVTVAAGSANQLLTGAYNIKVSSGFNAGATNVLFDYNGTTVATTSALYTGSIYTGSVVTIDACSNTGFSGEWVQLRCTSGIRAVSYRITGSGPTRFSIFGSNDATTWRRLDSSSQDLSFGLYNSPGRVFTMTAASGVFTFYRLVVTEPGINRSRAVCAELKVIDSTAVEHPPGNMTSSATGVTVSGITYTASASVQTGNAYLTFDGNTTTMWDTLNTSYSIAGNYRGTVVTTDVSSNSYAGEWVQIQTPTSIIATSYQVQPGVIDEFRWLDNYSLLGSVNETQWYLLDQRVSVPRVVGSSGGIALIPVNTITNTNTASGFTFFRLVVNKLRDSTSADYTTMAFVNLVIYGRVTGRTLPSNALFWSPPAVYQTSNTSFGAQMRHMSTDPSRALMLYWDVGPTADRPFQGDEFYVAWSSAPMASSGMLPIKDLDLTAVDYLTQAALPGNKFSVNTVLPASTVRNVRVGLQSQLTASGTPRLYLPVSGYRVSQNSTILRVPFFYELANSATMSDDFTRASVGGRVMQLLSHYLYNGILDTQMGYFNGFKAESTRVTDSMVDRLTALWRPNTSATYNRRNDFLSQLMNRYGRQYFADGASITNADGTQSGEVREVLRNIDDMFLNFSLQVGRRVTRRTATRLDTVQFVDIPVVMRLTNTMFADNLGPILNYDAYFVNASGATASGTLMTAWPNLAYRSVYTPYGSLSTTTAATVSGLTASGAFIGSVTGVDGTSVPAVYLHRTQGSYLSVPTVNFNRTLGASGFTLTLVCQFSPDSSGNYETPFQLSDVAPYNNYISLMRGAQLSYPQLVLTSSGVFGQFNLASTPTSSRNVYIITVAPSGATSSVNIWVNGTRQVTNSAYAGSLTNLGTLNVNNIGRSFPTDTTRPTFTGNLNQIQFYTRALTVSEATLLNAHLRYKWKI